jgi:cytochrome b involved in lipid metabolism
MKRKEVSIIDSRQSKKDSPKEMNSYFDSDWYLNEYPEVQGLIYQRAYRDAFDHYIKTGTNEGNSPHPNFDEKYYLRTNEDVEKAVISGEIKCGYHHFLAFGEAEGRSARHISTEERDARQALISVFNETTS